MGQNSLGECLGKDELVLRAEIRCILGSELKHLHNLGVYVLPRWTRRIVGRIDFLYILGGDRVRDGVDDRNSVVKLRASEHIESLYDVRLGKPVVMLLLSHGRIQFLDAVNVADYLVGCIYRKLEITPISGDILIRSVNLVGFDPDKFRSARRAVVGVVRADF